MLINRASSGPSHLTFTRGILADSSARLSRKFAENDRNVYGSAARMVTSGTRSRPHGLPKNALQENEAHDL
ncbi:unnamed protein product [Urochloa humidicola]